MNHLMRYLFAVIVFITVSPVKYFAIPIDTGWVKRIQPDGTKFTGREWGDEFGMQAETKDGYKFLYDSNSKYYVYAVINEKGDFAPTKYKVGIDNPEKHGITRYLERSPEKQALIEEARLKFNSEIVKRAERRKKNINNIIAKKATTPTDTLDIVLIDFYNVLGDSVSYSVSDFEDMFFSDSYTGTSPDGEDVFGSIKAYIRYISNDQVILTGQVLNNDNGGVPGWIHLPNTKGYYDSLSTGEVGTAFKNAAEAAGLNVDTRETRNIAYIYGGNMYANGDHALHPRYGSNSYWMSEKVDTDHATYTLNRDTPPDTTIVFTFAHIGQHVHELCHDLGLPDNYNATWFCVMSRGLRSGPRIGSCPSPPNAVYRSSVFDLWYDPIEINTTTENYQIDSGIDKIYKLRTDPSFNLYQYFLEHRTNDGFGRYIESHPCEDNEPGMVLYYYKYTANPTNKVTVVAADNSNYNEDQEDIDGVLGDPFPGASTNQNISDYTSPVKLLKDSKYPHLRLNNITNNDTNTTADIYINYWQGVISENTTWQDTVYVGNDITVISGDTLTIDYGSLVNIFDGIDVNIYGALTLNGDVTITKTPGGTYWYGLITKAPAGTIKLIGENTLEYAMTAIQAYTDSCFFPDSTTVIRDCYSWGMAIYNRSPEDIKNIYFRNNGTMTSGNLYVYGTASNPTISNVTMDDSFYGFGLYYYADATFSNNYITDNTVGHRVWLQGYNGFDIQDRHNDICDTSAQRYALYMGAGMSLDVAGNYWGSENPDSTAIFYPTGMINSWRDQDTSPNGAGAPGHTSKLAVLAETNNPFIEAQELEQRKEWDYAIDSYNDIITSSDKLWQKRKAIKSLIRVYEKTGRNLDDIRTIIAKELETASSWYKASLDYLLCELFVREGTYEEAISAFSNKSVENAGTPMEVEMLARIANIYGDYLGDKTKAKEYADRAAIINPGQYALIAAYASADLEYNPSDFEDKYFVEYGQQLTEPLSEPANEQEPGEESEIEEFVKVEANPFNPSTSIVYSIQEASHIKINVYSISGQKVATLVDSFMSAGAHSAKFDGSRFASGIYFYRFESKGFNQSGKMMLVK